MTELLGTVMIASLVGSAHCAGMCGGFAAIATAASTPTTLTVGGQALSLWQSHVALQIGYHVGRLGTYATMGLIAGAIGSAVDLGGERLAGVQSAAAILAGATIAMMGLAMILRISGVRLPRLPLPDVWVRALASVHQRGMRLPPTLRSIMIGLVTTLLPCGWLYAFVVTAAGTARPDLGVIVMLAFWVGTLPMLVAVGAGARAAAHRLGPRLPLVTAVLLIGVGVASLTGRLNMIGRVTPAEAHAVVSVGQSVSEAASSAAAAQLPCCDGH